MITLYKNFDLINKKYYINDVESVFNGLYQSIIKSEDYKLVVKYIEHGEVMDNGLVKNKFGIAHPIQISTGSKALLLALYSSTSIVNFLETGNNVTRCMFKYFKDRDLKIYLPQIVIVKNAENLKVLLDGRNIVSYESIS